MEKSRAWACSVLGLSISASEEEIKSSYKFLVKLFHPDAGKCSDVSKYNEIVEAYDYLCKTSCEKVPEGKIINSVEKRVTKSGAVTGGSQFRRTGTSSDYASFEKKIKKQQEQKAKEFERKSKEYSAKLKKQDEDYKRAMEAIDAIRAARAIEAMVWANGLGKDERKDKE